MGSGTTLSGAAPAAPLTLKPIKRTLTSVEVEWTHDLPYNPLGFMVHYRKVNGNSQEWTTEPMIPTGEAKSLVVPYLTSATTYEFKVQAVKGSTYGNFSPIARATTLSAEVVGG